MKTRALFLLPVLFAACQSRGAGDEASIKYLVGQGDYKTALTRAQTSFEANPDDAAVAADYRLASVAFLLARGREATFEGRDEEALADFEQAVALDPTAEQAEQWRVKTSRKLSDRWYLLAREKHASDRLNEAGKAYEVALDYDRENESALAGLYRVGVQLGYREGLSEDYYNEGLSALRERSLHVSKSRFSYADKYQDGDGKPARRIEEVDRALSMEFLDRGLELEEQGFYAAAGAEYRVAKRLDEKNVAAFEGQARMLIEAEAHELLKGGQMWIRRGEFDKAVTAFEQGKALTKVQGEQFEEEITSIADLRAGASYEQAINYEHDFRFVEATQAYQKLLDERGFYKDVRARLTRLEQVIVEVQTLYASLASAEDAAALKVILERIDVLWPEYRDVQQRLDAMGGEAGGVE
ncbi:MAG: hypothetical protein O2816_10565 [Planctomycetota bacterium]|nr:hypothetical protein [Planctomycetota bacterium]